MPVVSVVMAVKDEATYIRAALEHLQAQTYPRDRIEILIVDGGSSDGTVELANAFARNDARIRLIGGPGVNCPAALNLGIAKSSGEFVAKIDGHGYVNRTFLDLALRRLIADPSIGCVGGRIEPTGNGTVPRANMIARFSILGVGHGVYTASDRLQDVDTVQCGVYRRAALNAAGGFDDNLQFGEDEELNYRVRMAGYRIVFDPALRFRYWIRPTIRSLWRQYRNYGRARVRVIRKHPAFLSAKHLAPPALVVGLTGAAVLALATRRMGPLSTTIIGGYAGFLMLGSLALGIRHRFPRADLIMASLASVHIGYGVGTLEGAVDWVRRR